MSRPDSINGYELTAAFTTAGGGQSRWAFARKGDRDYFLKEFLKPTFPTNDAPGSPRIKAQKRERCAKFEEHQRKVLAALAPLSKEGGNLVVARDFFRHGTKYYKVTDKIDVASITPAEIAHLAAGDRLLICVTAAHSLGILHRNRIVHGDLKPDNILIKRTDRFTTKLIDFDDAFFTAQPPHPDDLVGDPAYYSPEMFEYHLDDAADGRRLGTPSDVFALGLILSRYLTGSAPTLPDRTTVYPGEAVLRGKKLRLSPGALSGAGKALLEGMLDRDPASRPTVDEVFERLKKMRRTGDEDPDGTAVKIPVSRSGSGRSTRTPSRSPVAPAPAPAAPSADGPRLRGSLIGRAARPEGRPAREPSPATPGPPADAATPAVSATPGAPGAPPPDDGSDLRLRGDLLGKGRASRPPEDPGPAETATT